MSHSPFCWLHGWAANGHIFAPLQAYFPQHTIDTPDLAGHGTASSSDCRADKMAADLANRLPEAVHLMGWSWGGLIALYLAAHYPEKVKSLCLTATFARFLAGNDYPEGLKNMPLTKMLPLFESDYAKQMQQFLRLQCLYLPQLPADFDTCAQRIIRHPRPFALAAALQAMMAADARALLSQIRCPVLLVYGSKDSLTPPAMGQYLHRHLPESQLHIIDRAVHAPFFSHPATFADLYQGYLKTCSND